MKFKIAKAALLDVLQILQGIVATRTTLPILSNVLLKAENNMLHLTTTDLDVTVRCGIEADVGKGGASTVPARRLMSIVRELPAADVEMEFDEKHAATIKCGSAFFKVIGMSEDEFPAIPDFESAFSYTIDQPVLREMLKNTAYSASSDETRHILNGVLLSMKSDKLTMVATDGRRLALMEQDMDLPKEAESEAVVPVKAVTELLHALGDEGQVKVYTSSNQMAFEFNDILVVSKLIEGVYPNYKQVIPSGCEERVSLERETLLTAAKRVALLTSDKSNSVKMTFGKNKLKISAVTPDVGEAHETLAVKYTGKEISVAFNPEYLLDPLRQLTCDEIALELTDDLSPGVIKCEKPFLYVLMPMRIRQ